ncbi:MAG: hypothetical protein IPL88_16010 [Rhizobiales bacterium]|nr:hypothetical protein [Hyphomicrobiales bacterium]
MLSDPLRAVRIAVAVGLAAMAWVAIYALFNERLRAAIGDAAHASAFLAGAVAIASMVVASMFRRLARIRAALLADAALARWRASPAEWRDVERVVGPEVAADHRVTLGLIVFFAVLIPVVMALLGGDARVLAAIAAGIVALGLLGYALGRRHAKNQFRYRDGAVALGRDGLVVNGAFHGWAVFGSRLVDAVLDETRTPAILRVTYVYRSRAGDQSVVARAPVPKAALAQARAAVAALRGHTLSSETG